MKRILIQIKDNNIYFKSKKKLTDEQENIMNTNIISGNELTFSDEYILENEKIVITFLKELIKDNAIDTAIIYNNTIEETLISLLKYIPKIKSLILKDNIPLSFKSCNEIIKSNVTFISCFNLQDFLLEYLDKNNILVEIRCEHLFISDFMKLNILNKYSSIFYKKIIHFNLPLTKFDEDDFGGFLFINKYLRIIHVNNPNKNDLSKLIEIINKHKKKNLKIILHDNIQDTNFIDNIKKYNIMLKKNNIKISISYSDNYIKTNILKQTNVTILNLIIGLITLFLIGSFSYIVIDNYLSQKKVLEIQKNIKEIIKTVDAEEIIKEIEKKEDKIVINDYIASLRTVNTDTVAWLKVPNTKINYAVVQGDDNDFYLKRNFLKEKGNIGWIFMDARNNKNMIDDNTIIFGHNYYESSIMFGTLKNARDEEWLKNKKNHIISLDSLYDNLEYEIFSVYIVPPVKDYLRTNFTNALDRLEFFNYLKSRSEYDFDIVLNSDDKVLTLSTCEEKGTKRLVVHARLIKT